MQTDTAAIRGAAPRSGRGRRVLIRAIDFLITTAICLAVASVFEKLADREFIDRVIEWQRRLAEEVPKYNPWYLSGVFESGTTKLAFSTFDFLQNYRMEWILALSVPIFIAVLLIGAVPITLYSLAASAHRASDWLSLAGFAVILCLAYWSWYKIIRRVPAHYLQQLRNSIRLGFLLQIALVSWLSVLATSVFFLSLQYLAYGANQALG